MEHGVDAVGPELTHVALRNFNQVVQPLVEPGVFELVLGDSHDTEGFQRGTAFSGAVGAFRSALLPFRENDRMDDGAGRAQLRNRRPTTQLEIVRVSAKGQYCLNDVHTVLIGQAPLNARFWTNPNRFNRLSVLSYAQRSAVGRKPTPRVVDDRDPEHQGMPLRAV